MTAKPVIPRESAQRDIEEAIDHYVREAGVEVALGFIDALEEAYVQLSAHPAAGSPRYAYELGIAELRSTRIRRFPHLIFYVERPEKIDVWRVLHGKRDIPAWLRESGPAAPADD